MKENSTIIIVSYYTGDLLWRVIESALIQEALLEIIIVNNGNPDFVNDELKNLAEINHKIKVLNPGNLGFAKACNLGVGQSKGEYILLLNPDCVLKDKDVISQFIKYFEQNNEASLGICKILNPDNTIQKTCVRKLLTPLILFAEGLHLYKLPILNKYLPRINVEIENINSPIQVEAISGAFMIMRKREYEDIGGMDEGYFLHMEDMDLCKRVNINGGKIFYLPTVKAVHHLSTSNVPSIKVEEYKIKSFLRYFEKFYGKIFSIILAPLLFIRFILLFTMGKIKTYHPKNIIKKLAGYNKNNIESNLFKNIPEFDKNEEILVAGATNQIGLLVIKKLLELQYNIKALYKNSTINLHLKNIEWIQTDFTKDELLPKTNAKTFIYTAPIWMLPNLLMQLRETNLNRLICFSSTSIYTKLYSKNGKERKIVKQLVEAEEKVIAICKERNINYTIFRPTMIYGLGIDKNINFISNFIKKFKFFPIIGEAKGLRQPVHAEDLANATINIISNNKSYNKSYNLGGKEKISYKRMIERIFKYNRINKNIINLSFLNHLLLFGEKFFNLPFTSEMANRMNKNMIFDYEDAENDFNYAPREFLK